jgi:hypothetical protein
MVAPEKDGVIFRDKENLARDRVMELWKHGNLFFNTSRFPIKNGYEHIDRLAEILKNGLIPPSLDTKGKVISDLNIEATGFENNYNSVIFLHLFGDNSYRYIPFVENKICFFVDPKTKFKTNSDMHWPLLCSDEVYVPRIIKPRELIGVAVAPNALKSVYGQFYRDLKRLGLPLYDFTGKAFWPK